MTAALPLMNLVAALLFRETKPIQVHGKCQTASANIKQAARLLVFPTMYKPLIFIFVVVVAPGVTDAMFFYQSNVLEFSSTQFATI